MMIAVAAEASGDDRHTSADPAVTPPGLSALQRLIHDRMRDRGWSFGVVARRGGLPRSTVHHLASTASPVRPPRPATLEALARGLELPISVIRGAAAEAAGLRMSEAPVDREATLIMASLDELTADDRRHVTALIDSLRRK